MGRTNSQAASLASSGDLAAYEYGLDRVGNKTSVAGSDGMASNWSYDPTYQQAADFYISLATGLGWANLTLQQWNSFTLSQWETLPLTSTSIQAGSTGMAYSLCGNRQTQTEEEDGSVTTFTYDAANQLLSAEDTSGVTTYTYDANGNRLTIEEPGGDLTTNTWDPENRLVLVEHPGGGTTEYAYNGDGQRVEKTVDGTDTTKYIYDGNNMLQETDGSGTVEAKFTYALGEYGKVLSQHRGSDSHVYHFDGTDSVRLLTDDTGSVTDEYEFDAFGNLLSSTGSTPNSQLYKGRHLAYHVDPDAGPELQYALHYRNYEPSLGIFSNRDPAEDDSNLYRYVKNNPLNREDPSGLHEPGKREATVVESPLSFMDRGRAFWGDQQESVLGQESSIANQGSGSDNKMHDAGPTIGPLTGNEPAFTRAPWFKEWGNLTYRLANSPAGLSEPERMRLKQLDAIVQQDLYILRAEQAGNSRLMIGMVLALRPGGWVEDAVERLPTVGAAAGLARAANIRVGRRSTPGAKFDNKRVDSYNKPSLEATRSRNTVDESTPVKPAKTVVAPIRGLAGADDFASLGRTGTIDPKTIRFSQDSIGATFKNGESVADLTTKLKNGLDPTTIPPIRIVVKDGKVFTLDNRRLKAFQDAGIPIPFEKLDSIPKLEMFKFTTVNDGVDIVVRPGG